MTDHEEIVKWRVEFSENGEEYVGWLNITAKDVQRVEGNHNALIADGVHIEIDEYIISIERL